MSARKLSTVMSRMLRFGGGPLDDAVAAPPSCSPIPSIAVADPASGAFSTKRGPPLEQPIDPSPMKAAASAVTQERKIDGRGELIMTGSARRHDRPGFAAV